jgi:DNA-binding transcriptional LysR family regulator
MITQRRLQHLLALIEHAHFGRAAQSLDISQPALTKSIQALESELGVQLIDRKHGAIGPTVFGEVVIQRSQRMMTEEDELRREIRLLAGLELGSMKVALGPYPSVTSGYAAIARLVAAHPGIHVTAHVAGWREVASQVAVRTVDIGIAETRSLEGEEQFATELLGQHYARIFCRPGHPVLRRGPVLPGEILDFPWVATRLPARMADSLPRSLGMAGTRDPRTGDFVPAVEIDVPMQLSAFLSGSDALVLASLAIMEADLLAGRAMLVQMSGPEFRSAYGFIYLKDRLLSPATQAYMAEVRAVEREFGEREALLAARYVGHPGKPGSGGVDRKR